MNETILIVEDDSDLRGLIEEIFEDEGFKVVSAAPTVKSPSKS